MYCERCGTANPDGPDVRFCRGCGSELSRPVATAAPEPTVATPPPGFYPAASGGVVASAGPVGSQALAVPYGGFWVRLIAYIIDSTIVAIVTGIVALFVAIAVGVGAAVGGSTGETVGVLMVLAIALVPFVLSVGYYTTLPPLLGATLGKLALGYHIVGEDGRHIGFGRALLRYLGYIVSGLGLGLGYVWIGVDLRKQGWHDKIAGTYVVQREVVRP